MTREEAAMILDPETTRDALWAYDTSEERFEAVSEAMRLGAEALRGALTTMDGTYISMAWFEAETKRLKNELEKAIENAVRLDRSKFGCSFCLSSGLIISDDGSCMLDHIGLNKFTIIKAGNSFPKFEFSYCPCCGRPLTKEAWAKLEEKIGWYDEKTDKQDD